MGEIWTAADVDIAVHITGGSYVNLTDSIENYEPDLAYDTVEYQALNRKVPLSVATQLKGRLSLSAILGDDKAGMLIKDIEGNERREALFAVSITAEGFLGPIGYIYFDQHSAPNRDGLVIFDKAALADQKPGFEKWRYGRVTGNPAAFGFRNSGTGIFTNPIAGQWVLIHIREPGGLTSLDVTYRDSANNDYIYAAPTDNGFIEKGIHIAQLKMTNTIIPANRLTSGRWRLRRGGSVTRGGQPNADYDIGFIEY